MYLTKTGLLNGYGCSDHHKAITYIAKGWIYEINGPYQVGNQIGPKKPKMDMIDTEQSVIDTIGILSKSVFNLKS